MSINIIAGKKIFSFRSLKKHDITGPPKVMWGKHDETRALLHSAIDALNVGHEISMEELKGIIEIRLRPAAKSYSGYDHEGRRDPASHDHG